MITLKKIVRINGSDYPYTYMWLSDDSCATFSRPTGVINSNVIETDINLASESCDPEVSLFVTSGCGNSETFEISIDVPCSTFTLSEIVQVGNNFSVIADSVGCNQIQFEWVYSNQIFQQTSIVESGRSSTIGLQPVFTIGLSSVPIRVIATDCYGCKKEVTLTYFVRTPTAQPRIIDLFPDPNGGFRSGNILLPAFSGANLNTIQQALPAFLQAVEKSPGVYDYVFTGSNPFTVSTGSYTAQDIETNIRSFPGALTFVIHTTPTPGTITAPNRTIFLDCDDIPGSVVDIDITEWVVANNDIDWDTFQFVNPPISKSPSVFLTCETNRQIIKYTVPNPVDTDAFSFTVCDVAGNCAPSTTYTVVPCVQPPLAVDDDFTVPTNSVSIQNILSNDLGNGSPLDPSTVEITEVDPGITVTPNPDGTVTIVVSPGTTGTKRFKYRVKNLSGKWSNEAEVELTVVSAGQDASVIICN
jgi:hypothetical protein